MSVWEGSQGGGASIGTDTGSFKDETIAAQTSGTYTSTTHGFSDVTKVTLWETVGTTWVEVSMPFDYPIVDKATQLVSWSTGTYPFTGKIVIEGTA